MKLFFAFMALLFASTTGSMPFAQGESPETWEPQVAGRFYPGNETALKDQIRGFLQKTPQQPITGKPIAIISPHAGYQYSGQVAAYGYKAVQDNGFTRVIIVSPSHFSSGKRFRGVSILNVKNFKTPLGVVPVDLEACNQLLNSAPDTPLQNAPRKATSLFGSFDSAYQNEHSMETQLPFLQMALGNFKLVPIMVGILIDNDYDLVANAIRPLMDDNTLVVVSSDFTHFGEGYGYVPFKKDIEKNIRALDYGAIDKILSRDFDGLKQYRKETGINACGFLPILLMTKLLPADAKGELLNYDTSGRQSGNFTFSVSYASILFVKPLENPEKKAEYSDPKGEAGGKNYTGCLTNEEKATLLSLARSTLETYSSTGSPPKIDVPITTTLQEKYGVFVTLKKNGELRGCIGHIIPRHSLYQAVIENTINSSSNDRRFRPVKSSEVPEISIEISVLSPLQKISGPDAFVAGKEGILIKKGEASAVFLPQVAREQGWDKNETLCQLCRKAGLPPTAWESGDMEFFVFTADVFHEREKT